MEKFVNIIYKDLCRYNSILQYIDKNDVKQEIRFAILTAKKDCIYKVAARLVYNLCTDYGFSRKKGKDNFNAFYNQSELDEKQIQMIDIIEKMYLTENLTAKELCEKLNVKYTKEIQKRLFTCFPKNLGHVGKRKNSGNNKHLKKI